MNGHVIRRPSMLVLMEIVVGEVFQRGLKLQQQRTPGHHDPADVTVVRYVHQ